jgi:polyphosphate kinase 2 (PPK2 family)
MDVEERNFWDDYMKAYGDCIGATSTEHAPWYIVPTDDKRNARLIVSQVILETLESLDMRCPELNAAEAERLRSFRDVLLA